MTDLRQQVNWIIRQIQCIREKGCLCFGYPTDLSYEAKGKKLTAKFVDGSTREATIPIPGKLSELENDLGILDPGSIKYEAEATATHAVGTLTVGTSTYPVKETVTVLSYDAAERKLSFVDEAGQTKELTLNIPTKTSQLTNDGSGAGNSYLTKAEIVVEPALADGHKIATVTVDGQSKEVKETITTLELDKPNKKLVFKSNAGTNDILLSDLASSGAGQMVTHTHQLVNDGADGAHGLYIESERLDSTYIGKGTKEPVTMVQYAAPDGIKHPVAEIYETVTSIDETAVDEELRSKSIVFTNEKGERTSIAVSAMDARHVAYKDLIYKLSDKHLVGQLKHGGRVDDVFESVTTIRSLENGSKLEYRDEKGNRTTLVIPIPKKTSELVNDGEGSGQKFITTASLKDQWGGSESQDGDVYRKGNVQIVAYRGFDPDVMKHHHDNSSYGRTLFLRGREDQSGIMIAGRSEADLVMATDDWKRHVVFTLYRHTLGAENTFFEMRGNDDKKGSKPIFALQDPGGLLIAGPQPVAFKLNAQLRLDMDATKRPVDEWWEQYRSGFSDAKQINADQAADMLRNTEILVLKSNAVHRVNAFTMMLVIAQAITAVKTS